MKIYQSLKPQGLAAIMLFVFVAMFVIILLSGDTTLLSPQVIILVAELALIMYGLVFGRAHLSYCAPEIHGYKYFRSIPDFESCFRKQCIASDIVCYAIGYAVTIANLFFMPEISFTPLIGIIYLFITALGTLITAFVNTSHRAYIYTMMFSMIPLTCGTVIFVLADDIPKNFIPLSVQLIILGCVTVFAAVALILFYKRLAKNLRTSYGKG